MGTEVKESKNITEFKDIEVSTDSSKASFNQDLRTIFAEGVLQGEYDPVKREHTINLGKSEVLRVKQGAEEPASRIEWSAGTKDDSVEAMVPVVESSNLSVKELREAGGFDGIVDTKITLNGSDVVTLDPASGTCLINATGKGNEVYFPVIEGREPVRLIIPDMHAVEIYTIFDGGIQKISLPPTIQGAEITIAPKKDDIPDVSVRELKNPDDSEI